MHGGQRLIRGCWSRGVEEGGKSTQPCLNNGRESQLSVTGKESSRGGALETREQEWGMEAAIVLELRGKASV